VYKHCITEATVQRQRQFEQCLLEIMLKRHFEDITVNEICERLDVPRGMFYRYFDSKEDTLYALIDHTFEEMAPFKADAVIRPTGCKKHFLFWKKQKRLLDALQINNLDGTFLARGMLFALREDYDLMQSLCTAGHTDKEESLTFIINGICCMVLSWHHNGYQKSEEEMANILQKLLTTPLLCSTQ